MTSYQSYSALVAASSRPPFDSPSEVVRRFRTALVNSEKIVIPNFLFECNYENGHVAIGSMAGSSRRFIARYNELSDYVRLPFERVVIENETFMVLVEGRPDGALAFTPSFPKTAGSPMLTAVLVPGELRMDQDYSMTAGEVRVLVDGDPEAYFLKRAGEGGIVGCSQAFNAAIFGLSQAVTPQLKAALAAFEQNAFQAVLGVALVAMETLVFMNVKNVGHRRVAMTEAAAAAVGLKKVLIPRFTFHYLDVFRDADGARDLGGLGAAVRGTPERNAEMRRHLVRGHFKRRRSGIFWWGDFFRGNPALGEVTKTYRAADLGGGGHE